MPNSGIKLSRKEENGKKVRAIEVDAPRRSSRESRMDKIINENISVRMGRQRAVTEYVDEKLRWPCPTYGRLPRRVVYKMSEVGGRKEDPGECG